MGEGMGREEEGRRMKGGQGEGVEGRWGEEKGEGGDGGKWGGAARSQKLQTSPLTLPPQWKRKCQSRERMVGAAGMGRRQGAPGDSETEA